MALEMVDRPGLWPRAGISGLITGLDWAAAAALRPAGIAADAWAGLLAGVEAGVIAQVVEAAERKSDNG
ncbi:hypothetical protein [Oharaeibacter diazotrophicus]|nr:hypothetical protein [Oharaeibacter diazotrophicus]